MNDAGKQTATKYFEQSAKRRDAWRPTLANRRRQEVRNIAKMSWKRGAVRRED